VNGTRSRAQRGVALAIVLILLVVLTVLAASGTKLSALELRIAHSDEQRVQAFERAQSLVDAAVRDAANTPVLLPGRVLCARDCGADTRIALPEALYGAPDAPGTELGDRRVQVRVRRVVPWAAGPPVGTDFSMTAFDAAALRVEGIYDRSALGMGSAQINEGIAVVYGAAGDVVVTDQAGELGGS
jgi:hypothetical protein